MCPTKYRRAVVTEAVDPALQAVCLDIANRYAITFLEIGTDKSPVHFLRQSVPTYSPPPIARTVKSSTAREIFQRVPWVKKALWGGAFWPSVFFINPVGRHGSEDTIRRYVREQGADYECAYPVLYKPDTGQLGLFDQ